MRRKAGQHRRPRLALQLRDALRVDAPTVDTHELLNRSVDRREALVLDLASQLLGDLTLCTRPQLTSELLLRATAQVLLDVALGNEQVASVRIHPADDDVGVRMFGVVVIGAGPKERTSEVLLHLTDELPNERLEVDLGRVLWWTQ